MRTKPLTTGVLIVVLVTTISSQGMGQAVVRQVPAERPYFQQDRTSPSDLMVATGVTSNFADEILHSDKGASKACTPCCISEPLWSVYAGAVFLRRDSLDVAGRWVWSLWTLTSVSERGWISTFGDDLATAMSYKFATSASMAGPINSPIRVRSC